MGFTQQQTRKLRARLKAQHIRSKEVDGTILRYVEGWHVVAEANRIFGFDGWDRETIETKCVWSRQNSTRFAAAYLAKVRIMVQAGERRVIREGSGSGEASASSPGQAHEMAAKAAETDATKRAFMTFGNPFGLSLYAGTPGGAVRNGHANGSATRSATEESCSGRAPTNGHDKPHRSGSKTGRIEKSQLALSEPARLRDPAHLRFVASRPCLICRRHGAQAHHLRFAQPRALGRKVSDEFTVPLCSQHHRELHSHGDERRWWQEKSIDPIATAAELWAGSVDRKRVDPAITRERSHGPSNAATES